MNNFIQNNGKINAISENGFDDKDYETGIKEFDWLTPEIRIEGYEEFISSLDVEKKTLMKVRTQGWIHPDYEKAVKGWRL